MAIITPGYFAMIKVVRDDAPANEPQEPCALCTRPTNYWYAPRDVAVCQECAKTASVADVPTKRDWLIACGDELPEDWKADADRKGRKKKPPSQAPIEETCKARIEIYAPSAGLDALADHLLKKAAQIRVKAKLERWKGSPKWANVLIGPHPDSGIDPGDYRWGILDEKSSTVFFREDKTGEFLKMIDGKALGYAIIEFAPHFTPDKSQE
jgi:hypothetical protein